MTPGIRAKVRKVAAARRRAEFAKAAAQKQIRRSVRGLRKLGLSLRDCAYLLGVSHQRVHQIATEAR